MKNVILFLLIVSFVSAQYKPEHGDLIKTTFLREFDQSIINNYLKSDDDAKVNAALLSIAQSEDTTFVPQITKLDFDKYGEAIAFALGKIGECQASSDYLITQLQNNAGYSVSLYEALGKIGTEEDLSECIEIYKKVKNDGFPMAVFNFHIRGIIDSTQSDVNILLKNLKLTDNKEKLFRSIFTLYRVAPDRVNSNDLEMILSSNFDPSIKLYALGILRKNEDFSFSFELVKSLLESDEWNVRCEAARTVCYFPFETAEQVDDYLSLLFDENPNVARTAAQSLVNLNIQDEELNERFLEALDMLFSDDLTDNTKGEILLALQEFYPNDVVDLLEEHENDVNELYKIQMLGNYSYDPYYSFQKLRKLVESADDYTQFLINSSLTNLYDSLKTDEVYSNFIIGQYRSGTPLSITLFNYVIDSSFAATHSDELTSNINYLVDSKIDNPTYNSAISSLLNITDNIDTNLSSSILDKIANSKNYDLQYDLRNEIDLSETVKQYRMELFNKLFENSFRYSKAIVETDKGSFTIEFTPQVAPISVGNFIYLAEQGFYNDIIFHRVVPNFVIQTGDPSGTGWSGPEYTIVSEFSAQPFNTYYVGMASSGKDTEGSQWFVMQNDYPHLNGNYTNFGKVVDGFEAVDLTDQFDKVIKIELVK